MSDIQKFKKNLEERDDLTEKYWNTQGLLMALVFGTPILALILPVATNITVAGAVLFIAGVWFTSGITAIAVSEKYEKDTSPQQDGEEGENENAKKKTEI